jgi:hypothetical protein
MNRISSRIQNQSDRTIRSSSLASDENPFWLLVTGEYRANTALNPITNFGNTHDSLRMKASPIEVCKVYDFLSVLSYYLENSGLGVKSANFGLYFPTDNVNVVVPKIASTNIDIPEPIIHLYRESLTNNEFPKLLLGSQELVSGTSGTEYQYRRQVLLEGNSMNLNNIKDIFIRYRRILFNPRAGDNSVIINKPYPI